MFEKERLDIRDIEFENIFKIIKDVEEVSFSIFRNDDLLGEDDLKIARSSLEKEYELDQLYLKELYKDNYDALCSFFLEDIKREIDTIIMKEVVMNDTSKPLGERIKEARKFSNSRRLRIKDEDYVLYQYLYEYEFKKTIIDKYVTSKEKNVNALRFLENKLKKIAPYIYKYEIYFEVKEIFHPKFHIKYFFKLNEENKKIFISFKKGEEINIEEYTLYKNGEIYFIYDYNDMMYFLEDDWFSIGGTLAN